MVDSKAPGVSASVVQDGEFVWSAGFGMADLENSVPATVLRKNRINALNERVSVRRFQDVEGLHPAVHARSEPAHDRQ